MRSKILQMFNNTHSTSLQLKDVTFGLPKTRSHWADNQTSIEISHYTKDVNDSKGGEVFYCRARLSDIAKDKPNITVPGQYRGAYVKDIVKILSNAWGLPVEANDLQAERLPDEEGAWVVEARAYSLGYCGVGEFQIEYS